MTFYALWISSGGLIVEHVGMLEEAENLVKIGHFEEAFELFIALESGTYDLSD